MNYDFMGQTETESTYQKTYAATVQTITSHGVGRAIDDLIKYMDETKRGFQAFITSGMLTSGVDTAFADAITDINAQYSAILDSGVNLSSKFPDRWQQVESRYKGISNMADRFLKMNPQLGDLIASLKQDASIAAQQGKLDHPGISTEVKTQLIEQAYDVNDPYSKTAGGMKVRMMYERSGTPKPVDVPETFETVPMTMTSKPGIPGWLLGIGAAALAYFTFFR